MKTRHLLTLATLLVTASAHAATATITTEPANQTNCVETTAMFGVAAAGTEPLSYQWYFNDTNPLAAATNALLSIANAQAANAGGYTSW